MKLTNPQLAAIHRQAATHFPWAGSFEIFWSEPLAGEEIGSVDVTAYDDTDILATFQVDTLGRVTHYAEPVVL